MFKHVKVGKCAGAVDRTCSFTHSKFYLPVPSLFLGVIFSIIKTGKGERSGLWAALALTSLVWSLQEQTGCKLPLISSLWLLVS